jgi:signal peptidase I
MKLRSLVTGVIGLILVSLLLLQPYKLVVVVGRSMLPTLEGGQILLAKKTNSFERGDIIVVKEEDSIIIKRIKKQNILSLFYLLSLI